MPPLWKTVRKFPRKLNLCLFCDPAVLFRGIYPREMKMYVHKYALYKDVHSNFIHDRQKLETVQMLIRRMDKLIDSHRPLRNKREPAIDNVIRMNLMHNVLREKPDTKKYKMDDSIYKTL